MSVDWDALDRIEGEEIKAFKPLSSRYVSGEGDFPKAFIIGEAPGAQEEIAGRPFVGPSGKVLRRLMTLAGLRSDHDRVVGRDNDEIIRDPNCWLTNVIKFHPPGNRNPTEWEIKTVRPYLRREWLAVGAPTLVVPVGSIALRAIMGRPISILKVAGYVLPGPSTSKYPKGTHRAKNGKEVTVFPMIHPRYGISNPAAQPMMEDDWQRLGEWIKAGA